MLMGIANGILADGVLNHEEVRFLKAWLRDNAEVANVFPGNIIAARIGAAMADGRIDPGELEHLKQTLKDLVGGTLQETGEVDGWSTSLPVDASAEVVVRGRVFCFTGEFIYGTRTACTALTVLQGGSVKDSVSPRVDYLVIGGMASRYWANTSYGRKIEKAINLQGEKVPITIVSEDQWHGAAR